MSLTDQGSTARETPDVSGADAVAALRAEVKRLRETNERLNRRAQIAEAAINELANGTGKALGTEPEGGEAP